MSGIGTNLALVFGLVLANGLFSAAEIAVVSVRKSRIRHLIDEGNPRAESVARLHAQAERFLATVQVGVTVVGALAAAIGGASLADPLAAALLTVPSGAIQRAAPEIALGVVVAGLSFVTLVFGELVPKSIALRYAEPLALFLGRPLIGLGKVTRPIVWLLTGVANLVLKPLHDRTSFSEARLTAEEIKILIGEATETGAIERRLGEIIERAVDFGELTVADVQVPRPHVVAIDKRWPADEIRRVLLEEGHTRMPVIDGGLDKVVGYVTAKDVVPFVLEKELVLIHDIIRPPFFVPQTMGAVDLLRALQKRREHLAIVVDEYGGTAGICTMEDLVEEIVGEIFSEDSMVPELVKREADGAALVSAILPIREFNRTFESDLPEDQPFDTLAGLLTHIAGVIPAAGQSFEAHGFKFTVIERTERRVKQVRVQRLVPAAPA